jgi:hypothetical protein
MTKAPFLPWADRRSQWFSTRSSPLLRSNRLVCMHTTEMGVPGEPWPAYTYRGQVGGSAPHWTVKPDRERRRLMWRQHWRADEPARALEHPTGTPETNNAGVLQIELGGTSVAGDPGYYWADPDDWAVDELARFDLWALDEWGIPLTDEGRPWHALSRNRADYIVQAGGSTRLSWAEWQRARGYVGHQHVPGNSHVDPGALPVPRILARARQIREDDDMPTAAEIAEAVWDHRIPRDWDGDTTSAAAALASSQRYAIEGGADVNRPPGNTLAGSPTHAKLVLSRLDELQGAIDEVRKLVTPAPAQ